MADVNIYDELNRRCGNVVGAYVILDNVSCPIGKIVLIQPTARHGMPNLTAYAHYYGTKMVKGKCGAYGTDRVMPALAQAAGRAKAARPDMAGHEAKFWEAIGQDDGRDIHWHFREIGWNAVQVI